MSANATRSLLPNVAKGQESDASGTHMCDPLGAAFLRYAVDAERLETPDAVLDRLHAITWQYCRLSVLGAGLLSMKVGDLNGVEKGKTVFLHKSVPKGWWEDYLEMRRKYLDVGTMMARLILAPYTWTESRLILEPLGIDRWPFELALKYGMRDGLTCPVGGRWVVGYWSRKVLSKSLTPQVRVVLFMGANFAAIRLQQLVGQYANRIGKGASLTPRELSVLRCQSVGKSFKEIADGLNLGEETIRSHIKKAAAKLGVRNRTHAVAQALRLHLIP